MLAPGRAAQLESAATHTITATRRLAQDDLTADSDTEAADAPTSVAFGEDTPFDPIRFQAQYQLEDADPEFAEQLRVSSFLGAQHLSCMLICRRLRFFYVHAQRSSDTVRE